MIRTTLNLVKLFPPDRKRTGAAFLFGSSLLFASAALPAFAQELQAPETAETEDGSPKLEDMPGLYGLYGQETNPDLDTEYLADKLPENWQDWAMAFDEEMLSYSFSPATYEFSEKLDVKAQRELIKKLHLRLDTMQQAIADSRFAPIHDTLINLAGPLERSLKTSTALLDTLDEGVVPISKDTHQESIEYLRESTEKLNAFLSQHPGGEEWKQTFGVGELSQKLADPNPARDNLKRHLEETLKRLNNREEYTADQLRLLRSNPFWQFHRAVSQAQALLEWEEKAPRKKELRETLQELGRSLVALERHHLVQHVQTMQLAWDQLVLLNPNAKERFAFLNTWFYSPNLYTQTNENVFNQAIVPQATESEPINEVTESGATVRGNTVTTTTRRIDLVPSPQEARMAIKVNGDIKAHAVGQQCSIKVYTQGAAEFWAEKQSTFNGFAFHPEPAKISVNAMVIPYAARTPVSCLPGLGSCFESVVLNQATAQRPESEAEMRQRIAERVIPELNREVNSNLAEANDDLQNNRYRRLSKYNLYPVLMQTATTETHLLSKTLIRDRVELGGGPPPLMFNHPTGMNYHIHESLINNIADRMDLAGRTMTEDEFRAEVERFFSDLIGYEFDFSKVEEATEPSDEEQPMGPDKFVFDKVSPFKVQIRNNQLQLTVRTALVRADGEKLDPHDIMIPIEYQLEGDLLKIVIDKDKLGVSRVGGGGFGQNAGVNSAIRRVISGGERSRDMTLNLEDGRTLELRTEQIKALDGWLSLWAVPVESAPVTPTEPIPALAPAE